MMDPVKEAANATTRAQAMITIGRCMRIGVIGLGAMGLGIAQGLAQAGHEVRATDAEPRRGQRR